MNTDPSPLRASDGRDARPTVAFIFSRFPSHLFGSFGVARRIQDLGFRVEYWGDDAARKLVLNQKFQHYGLGQIWPCYEPVFPGGIHFSAAGRAEIASRLTALRDTTTRLPEVLDHFESSLDAQLARCKPVLAVLDSLATAYFPLLRARGVKCVLLQDKPALLVGSLAPPPTTSHIPRDTRTSRAAVAALWTAERIRRAMGEGSRKILGAAGIYTHSALLSAILTRSRRPACVPLRRVYYDLTFAGLDEWLTSIPELDFPGGTPLPDSVRYIGNCVDLQRVEISPPMKSLRARRLIYVSMGATVAHWRLDMEVLSRVLTATATIDDVDVVVATGDHNAATAVRARFPGLFVSAYLPQLTFLKSACLAITHAGANAVRECVATETPMFAFPRAFDQYGNAARIVKHGIGLCGSRRRDRSQDIRNAIGSLLEDDSYKSTLHKISVAASKSESSLLRSALKAAVGIEEVAQNPSLSGSPR